MITISHYCDTCKAEVKQAERLLSAKKVILILPTLLLLVLSIALAIVFKNVALLAIAIVAVAYVIVMVVVLQSVFSKKCKSIVEKYYDFYKIDEQNKKLLDACIVKNYSYSTMQKLYSQTSNSALCSIVADNQGYLNIIGASNSLYAWEKDDSVCFISVLPMSLNKLRYFVTDKAQFCSIAQSDFGCLIVPMNVIDHYRENVMVCTFGANSLCKFTFSDSNMLDQLIPKKDFYYQSKKKNEI